MKATAVYDETGKVYSIIYGEEVNKTKMLKAVSVDIPDGFDLLKIDPISDQPVFVNASIFPRVTNIEDRVSQMSDVIDIMLSTILNRGAEE